MKINSKILSVGLLAITLLVIEGALRYFTPFPIHAHRANQVDDDFLSYRLDVSLGGVDSNGFRNPAVPSTVDIAAIGDSHTYGVNVESEDSWPSQLAAMANMSVYNFGVSGYDILQYDYLIDEAVKLKPRYVIVALYISNDLKVCKLIKSLDYWRDWAKERGYEAEFCRAQEKKRSRFQLTNFQIVRHAMYETAIGSLATYVWELISDRYSLGTEGESVVVKHPTDPTIITAEALSNHNINMDFGRQETALGFTIASDVLVEANDRLAKQNISLLILLVPSKEGIYFDYLKTAGYRLPQAYYDVMTKEKSLHEKFITLFKDHHIDYVDAAPYVNEAIRQGKQVYFNVGDGHPAKAGYRAYAKAVLDHIRHAR